MKFPRPLHLPSCLLALALFLAHPAARANIRLPSLFGDHMVLQQQDAGGGVWLWGRADRDEAVEVRLGTATARAVGDEQGAWACKLTGLPPAGGPYEVTVTGKNTLTLRDVLVGEVWLCSGQSNMGFGLHEAMNHDAEIAAADYPQIRLFSVSHVVAETPTDDPKGEWRVCRPGTVPDFSAVGYFFGRELHQNLHQPIGLIDGSWGGTPAEAWTPLAAMQSDPDLQPAVTNFWQKVMKSARLPLAVAEYDAKYAAQREAKAQGQADDKTRPRNPRNGVQLDQNDASTLYNGMIAPLMPYTMRGTIWYQGESNVERAATYQKLLSTMIGTWREGFASGDSPFYVVQLANFMDRKTAPGDSVWALLREAQARAAQTVPHSGLAVAIDLGDAKDIHPKNKQDVGHRLALLAEARTYGQKVVDQGPVYRAMKVEGDKVRVSFESTTSALVSSTGEKIRGFAVAGEDHQFAWAEATLEGAEVIVHCDRVPAPVAVRYGWADNPEVGLYNEAGLPASPFRSDDWAKSGALSEQP